MTVITRAQVVAYATSFAGRVDQAYKTNEFTREWGINGLDYCAAFVSSIFWRLGAPLPDLGVKDGFLYVPYAVDYSRATGQAVEVPGRALPGDVALFCWDGRRTGGPGAVGDHTGIVVDHDGGTSLTVMEGNTAGEQGQGRGTHIRRRNISTIACYWRPTVYDDSFGTASVREEDMPLNAQDLESINSLVARAAGNVHAAVTADVNTAVGGLRADVRALTDAIRQMAPGQAPAVDADQVADRVAAALLRNLLAPKV